MNARKHREIKQAKETDRLGPKGKQSGSSSLAWLDANVDTAGVKSGPKSSCEQCITWKSCQPHPSSQLGRPYRKAGRRNSIGMTEKAKASSNALDMPTSVWSEMAREHAELQTNRRKQMTTDSRRLMRSGVVAPTEHNAKRLPVSTAKLPACQAAGRLAFVRERPYEGSSRMKGNFHVRFQGGCGRATACTYPTQDFQSTAAGE